jgi:transcriptional regulator with XRE-family HTH domain
MAALATKSDFGRLLREYREAAGLSQAELADRAGIHRRTVIKIERGEREPHWPTAVALAGALGKKITDFLPEEVEPPAKGKRRPPRNPDRRGGD